MNLKSLIRYVNTVKFLKPSQLFYQIRYRIFRKSCKNITHEFQLNGNTDIRPVSLFIGTLDLSENFLNRFDADGLLNNNFKLLNQSAHVDLNKWYNHEMSHLWNFNLHYFEYAVPLADKFIKTGDFRYLDKFRELINTWISMPKTGDGWHPYTSSLRIINWLICMDILGDSLDKDFRKLMYKSIYEQYIFITKNFELHILGNHYFDNLKTAVICAVLFNDSKNLNKYLKLLKKEIKEEILPDGMHFELSFMYHKIIMESLIRTLNVLRQLGESENKAVKDFIRFSEKILAKMADALYYAENGIDRTPLFNDSGDNVAKTKDSLFIVCRYMFRIIPQKVDCLNYSGYYRLEDGSKTLLIDCGQAGSSYIPGHSQCDALSFELFCGGMPVFVNSGTGLYQGVERQYFRSTKAHNTVVINGREQSECWGEHRTASRIHDINAILSENKFLGEYKSYSKDIHKRIISLNSKILSVDDFVDSPDFRYAESYLHLGCHISAKTGDNGIINIYCKGRSICTVIPQNCKAKIINEGDLCLYAPCFGDIMKTQTIEFKSEKNNFGYRIIFG